MAAQSRNFQLRYPPVRYFGTGPSGILVLYRTVRYFGPISDRPELSDMDMNQPIVLGIFDADTPLFIQEYLLILPKIDS